MFEHKTRYKVRQKKNIDTLKIKFTYCSKIKRKNLALLYGNVWLNAAHPIELDQQRTANSSSNSNLVCFPFFKLQAASWKGAYWIGHVCLTVRQYEGPP